MLPPCLHIDIIVLLHLLKLKVDLILQSLSDLVVLIDDGQLLHLNELTEFPCLISDK